MRKTKFGVIVLSINALATAVLLATALQGSKRVLFGLESIQLHVLLALTASLGIFFAHSWVVIYLVSLGRELRSCIAKHGLQDESAGLLATPAFLGWALAPLGILLVTYFLGIAVLLGRVPAWSHSTAFWIALALQLWSLGVEKRAMRTYEANLNRLHQAVS